MRLPLRIIPTIAMLVALAGFPGCASPATPLPTATPEPPLDAGAILQRAAARMLDLRTATFTLEHRSGSTALFPGIEMTRASGAVQIPDRYRLVVEAQSTTPKAFIEVSVVGSGGKVQMTDFFTGKWREVSQSSLPVEFSRLGGTLAEIILAVTAPELVGAETVNGVETHRIQGVVKSQELAGLVPGAGQGLEVSLDLWVDLPEGWVHQVLITGMVLGTDIPEAQRVLVLGDFDLDVAIELPQ